MTLGRRRSLALVVAVLGLLFGSLSPVAADDTDPPFDGPATAVIRGHVLDEHGRGVDGFEVVAYPGWPYYTGDNPQASTTTHASADGSGHGYFELWVPAGEYDLLVSGNANGAYGPDWQWPTVVVGDGAEYEFGDIYMRPHNAAFTGKVVGADGRGIDDILVQAWLVGGSEEPVASALTYASHRGGGHGYYELFLPDNYGSYLVRFSDPDGRYTARDYRDGREVLARSRVFKELLPTTMTRTGVSGVVTDQFGREISGADVTLLHPDGVPVGDGDAGVMDPAVNLHNPSTTGTDGAFGWSLSAGSYEVSVTAATSHGAACFVSTTGVLDLPPARSDLLLKTTCPGAAEPVPSVTPVLSGTAQVGQTLSATAGEWTAPLSYLQTQWLRDGVVVGSGSSYAVTAADAGKQLTARISAARPDQAGVSFTPATYELVSATVTTPRPVATTTTAGLADDKVDTSVPASVNVAVVRADRQAATGPVEVYVDGVRVRTASLTAADGGLLSLALPTLGEGKYQVRVVYVGVAGVLGSQSAVLTLKVKKAKH